MVWGSTSLSTGNSTLVTLEDEPSARPLVSSLCMGLSNPGFRQSVDSGILHTPEPCQLSDKTQLEESPDGRVSACLSGSQASLYPGQVGQIWSAIWPTRCVFAVSIASGPKRVGQIYLAHLPQVGQMLAIFGPLWENFLKSVPSSLSFIIHPSDSADGRLQPSRALCEHLLDSKRSPCCRTQHT